MKVGDAWAKAFGIEGPKGERDGPLARAMLAFQDEIEALESQLSAAGIPGECYASQLERLRITAAPGTMRSGWEGMLGNVNPPDVRLALLWARSTPIPGEGDIPEEQLASLLELLEQLDQGFAAAGLPPAMAEYAATQLRNVREALQIYRVKGAAPMRVALQQAFGATVEMGEAMAEEAAAASPEARSYMERVGAMLTRAVVVCKDVDSMYKGGSAMMTMAEKLRIAWNVISEAIK